MPLFIKRTYKIIFNVVTVISPFYLFSQTSLQMDKEYMIDVNSMKIERGEFEPSQIDNNFKAILSKSPYVKLEKSNSDIFIQNDFRTLHRLVDGGLNYQKNEEFYSDKKALLLEVDTIEDTLKINRIYADEEQLEVEKSDSTPLKNQINMNYLHIDHDKYLYASSIYTLEYIRKEGRNTFVGRINSTSRHSDLGIQGELDWYHVFQNRSYFMINLGIADRFFPKFKAGASYYQPFKNAWVGEIGVRYFYDNIDDRSQLFGIVGFEKEISNFWINAKYTFGTESDFRNHFFLQSRMFMKDEKSYITAMGGIGNMPEVNDLNYLAQNEYSIRNTMLGAGYTHFFSKHIQAKVLLNWYNYKVNENDRSNQFHALFSVGYLF